MWARRAGRLPALGAALPAAAAARSAAAQTGAYTPACGPGELRDVLHACVSETGFSGACQPSGNSATILGLGFGLLI